MTRKMTSKESFAELHRIEQLIKNAQDYDKRQELQEERSKAIRRLVPEVGLPCTIWYYSDRRAATVVEMPTSSKVIVRRNKVKCIDYYAGTYEILPELIGDENVFTRRSNGRWIMEGQASKDGVELILHYQSHYIDPSF